jgi:hypothetical protein
LKKQIQNKAGIVGKEANAERRNNVKRKQRKLYLFRNSMALAVYTTANSSYFWFVIRIIARTLSAGCGNFGL